MAKTFENSSFKDPDARVFEENGNIYREIYNSYSAEYSQLMNSGLYEELVNNSLLIPHEEIENTDEKIVIKPEIVEISYPYEWSFSMLKDAALCTLEVLRTALKYNMILKDASAFNIQFYKGKPVFIDTTSFGLYEEGKAWDGYQQFCRHFLSPLLLMSYVDIRLSCLLKDNIDGIPLDITSKLLPKKTFLNFNILSHIHLHSKMLEGYSHNTVKREIKIPRFQLEGMIDGLIGFVKSINPPKSDTEWGEYYSFTNYTDKSFDEKKRIIENFKSRINPQKVWDFGANTGLFSRIFNDCESITCFDIDFNAVEKNYSTVKEKGEENIIPLVFDLTNPTPAIGWANKERKNIFERAKKVDVVLALALIHHLAISNNLPMEKIAEFFSSLAPYLIIEFVEKEDTQVQKLLVSRDDIFKEYTIEGFEHTFAQYYNIIDKIPVKDTKRTLYLLEQTRAKD